MAFQFDLETELDEIFLDEAGTHALDFALGYDLDDDKVIMMSVLLVSGESYLQGEVENLYDLQFGIRERFLSEDEHVTPPDFSTSSVEKYIPRQFRRAVFDVLLQAIKKLLAEANPSYLTMETFYGSLPPKALRKYEEIKNALASCGYEQLDNFRDKETGIDYWLFRKSN